jgi:hypothetical protein
MTIEGKAKQVDFDSAIPRFESWHPSQPVRGLSPVVSRCARTHHISET